MLVLTRRVDEEVLIGDDISVKVLEVRGDQIRLGFVAPRDVRIDRAEVRARPASSPRQEGGPLVVEELGQPGANLTEPQRRALHVLADGDATTGVRTDAAARTVSGQAFYALESLGYAGGDRDLRLTEAGRALVAAMRADDG